MKTSLKHFIYFAAIIFFNLQIYSAPDDVIVSGASSDGAFSGDENGTYVYAGEHNGLPSYSRFSTAIYFLRYNGSQWEIFEDAFFIVQLYVATSGATALPPATGWTSVPPLGGTTPPTLSGGALPVELVTFSAALNDAAVLLKWETATEVNNYGFDVERKPEDGDWNKAAFIQGNGTTNSPKKYSFTDSDLPGTSEVSYRLKQIDNDGTIAYSKEITVDLTAITDLEDQNKPIEFTLGQNYPNPFNPSTTIKFSIPESGNVILKVYNLVGQEIRTLLQKQMSVGQHEVNFNANGLPSGFYTYRIDIDGKYNSVKKMMLVK